MPGKYGPNAVLLLKMRWQIPRNVCFLCWDRPRGGFGLYLKPRVCLGACPVLKIGFVTSARRPHRNTRNVVSPCGGQLFAACAQHRVACSAAFGWRRWRKKQILKTMSDAAESYRAGGVGEPQSLAYTTRTLGDGTGFNTSLVKQWLFHESGDMTLRPYPDFGSGFHFQKSRVDRMVYVCRRICEAVGGHPGDHCGRFLPTRC